MPNGCVASQRDCGDPLHRFDTLELPHSVISDMGPSRFGYSLKRAWAGVIQRAQTAKIRRTVTELYGKTPNTRIAKFCEISEARVRQIAAELKL
jgi:hypothetical protein